MEGRSAPNPRGCQVWLNEMAPKQLYCLISGLNKGQAQREAALARLGALCQLI